MTNKFWKFKIWKAIIILIIDFILFISYKLIIPSTTPLIKVGDNIPTLRTPLQFYLIAVGVIITIYLIITIIYSTIHKNLIK